MKNKKWLIPVIIVAVIAVLTCISVCVIINKGFGISIGRYLEPKQGVHMIVLNGSPIQMSKKIKQDLFDSFDTGDRIVILHDGILETYPGRTGVYAAFKLSGGTTGDIPQTVVNGLIELGWFESNEEPNGILAGESFDTVVSYAGWAESDMIYMSALNRDKMIYSNIRHLPIYKFDTLDDLDWFKASFDEFATEQGYDEVPSFLDTAARYDQKFFEENTLMLVYVGANSGTYRYGVNSVFCDGTFFCIHVEQINHPEDVTDDMAGWFITVSVPDSMVETCTAFDADLIN